MLKKRPATKPAKTVAPPAKPAPATKKAEAPKAVPTPPVKKMETKPAPKPVVKEEAPKPEVKKEAVPKPAVKKTVEAVKPNPVDIAIKGIEETIARSEHDLAKFKAQIERLEAYRVDQYKEIKRLTRIKEMTKLIEPPYQWHKTTRPGAEFRHTSWSEDYTYKTVRLYFTITIEEFTDAKKYKYGVVVTGRFTKPGLDNEYGEVDYQYLQNKYMRVEWIEAQMKHEYFPDPAKGNVDLQRKYETEKEARKAVEEWKHRLVADHQNEIDFELELFNACKELTV